MCMYIYPNKRGAKSHKNVYAPFMNTQAVEFRAVIQLSWTDDVDSV